VNSIKYEKMVNLYCESQIPLTEQRSTTPLGFNVQYIERMYRTGFHALLAMNALDRFNQIMMSEQRTWRTGFHTDITSCAFTDIYFDNILFCIYGTFRAHCFTFAALAAYAYIKALRLGVDSNG